ncbi:MAG TPA: Rrf2 family transcriptional regulator [Candidatus Saccharimonadales bacterium]|nr:Rrf2 family transcriptional regulator [Candidatus Saccharimonadales bacterium]
MIFSRSTEYAIRAMTFLASQEPGKLAGAREISEAEGIPMPFLWKILQQLTRRKLVRSFKGIRGGYELARPAKGVNLNEIFLATDGIDFRDNCVLGLPQCDLTNPCPLHDQWTGIRSGMTEMLDGTSLADLASVTRRAEGGPKH